MPALAPSHLNDRTGSSPRFRNTSYRFTRQHLPFHPFCSYRFTRLKALFSQGYVENCACVSLRFHSSLEGATTGVGHEAGGRFETG